MATVMTAKKRLEDYAVHIPSDDILLLIRSSFENHGDEQRKMALFHRYFDATPPNGPPCAQAITSDGTPRTENNSYCENGGSEQQQMQDNFHYLQVVHHGASRQEIRNEIRLLDPVDDHGKMSIRNELSSGHGRSGVQSAIRLLKRDDSLRLRTNHNFYVSDFEEEISQLLLQVDTDNVNGGASLSNADVNTRGSWNELQGDIAKFKYMLYEKRRRKEKLTEMKGKTKTSDDGSGAQYLSVGYEDCDDHDCYGDDLEYDTTSKTSLIQKWIQVIMFQYHYHNGGDTACNNSELHQSMAFKIDTIQVMSLELAQYTFQVIEDYYRLLPFGPLLLGSDRFSSNISQTSSCNCSYESRATLIREVGHKSPTDRYIEGTHIVSRAIQLLRSIMEQRKLLTMTFAPCPAILQSAQSQQLLSLCFRRLDQLSSMNRRIITLCEAQQHRRRSVQLQAVCKRVADVARNENSSSLPDSIHKVTIIQSVMGTRWEMDKSATTVHYRLLEKRSEQLLHEVEAMKNELASLRDVKHLYHELVAENRRNKNQLQEMSTAKSALESNVNCLGESIQQLTAVIELTLAEMSSINKPDQSCRLMTE